VGRAVVDPGRRVSGDSDGCGAAVGDREFAGGSGYFRGGSGGAERGRGGAEIAAGGNDLCVPDDRRWSDFVECRRRFRFGCLSGWGAIEFGYRQGAWRCGYSAWTRLDCDREVVILRNQGPGASKR